MTANGGLSKNPSKRFSRSLLRRYLFWFCTQRISNTRRNVSTPDLISNRFAKQARARPSFICALCDAGVACHRSRRRRVRPGHHSPRNATVGYDLMPNVHLVRDKNGEFQTRELLQPRLRSFLVRGQNKSVRGGKRAHFRFPFSIPVNTTGTASAAEKSSLVRRWRCCKYLLSVHGPARTSWTGLSEAAELRRAAKARINSSQPFFHEGGREKGEMVFLEPTGRLCRIPPASSQFTAGAAMPRLTTTSLQRYSQKDSRVNYRSSSVVKSTAARRGERGILPRASRATF